MQIDHQHSSGYALGHSNSELERLMVQSQVLGDLTSEVLRRAGVTVGMRVVDLGCGPGDVSFLAASLVGSSGSVLGVDRSEESLALARRRAARAGLSQVRFESADIATWRPTEPADALIGRLVLMFLPDPAATLRQVVRDLPTGAILAFQEIDTSTARSVPECPLYQSCTRWIGDTLRKSGAEPDMGSRLHSTFRRAGLPHPQLSVGAVAAAGADSPIYDYVAQTVASLLPLMDSLGIISAASVAIDSLAHRLREEAMERDAVLTLPNQVGAWTRIAAK
jgi:SAM-dependent methyltransferase